MTHTPQHIIAIGASAGGIEAIYTFFDHTPLDKASYIIIQHLSPDHQSRLAQLLEKHSKLDIDLAENGMVVEPNKIYVIPNKQFMTLQKGTLYLTSKAGKKGPHHTINTFFHSLAKDQGGKAVGIILSGMGSDGSEGIKAIKKAGGLVIVQDPVTASYDSMPQHALATGVADWVLAPEEMPMQIQVYVHQLQQHTPVNPPASSSELEEKEESTLVAILDLLKSKLPMDFSDYKRATIFRRIRKRMAHHGVNDSRAYLQMLSTHPIELQALAQDFLISVTSFFRDREAFDLIERDVIPQIMNAGEAVKIWVAGCATGEEAYSLAILVQEYVEKTNRQIDVKIFATDLDKLALAIASKGIYPESIAGSMLKERLDRYFIYQNQSYRIKPELRKMLIFAPHNLGKNPPYANMDLISCRNLLIYMNKDLQEKIFSMLHFGLKKGGFLFLGASENTTFLHTHMEEISRKWKIYKKKAHIPLRLDTFSLPIYEDGKSVSLPSSKQAEATTQKPPLGEVLSEIVITEYGGAGVCVDENLQVVDSFGELTTYLLPKVFNFNLLDLLPEPLALPVRAALQRALKSGQGVGIKSTHVGDSQEGRAVEVLVKPFTDRRLEKRFLLVLFRETSTGSDAGKERGEKWMDTSLQTREYVESLEEELRQTKEKLHDTQEKLVAMGENMLSFNEELLSANEEMQSANEEMQSSNEELQSVNEELQNVNSEYQGKIKELTELNDDLNNYFRSNVNGQVFVDRELKLKKFSPSVVELINLQERDIGRPLDHITTNIKFETFREDMTKVIAEGGIIVKEVQSAHKCYQVMAMPYIRQSDNRIDGAILTFYEITELKRLQGELQERNTSLLRINDDLDTFVFTASHDLLNLIAHIQGLIELLHITNNSVNPDTSVNPQAEEFYRMIDTAITKFKALIRELSGIGKIESERLREGEDVYFEELIEDIKLSIATLLEATHTQIEVAFEVPSIHFSKKNLRSMLYNLISNAIKYKSSERDPHIVIHTKALPGFLLLRVEDNGMGIEQSKVASIFTLYHRLSEQIEGQGIGLYLTQKIIHAAGGHIEVESKVGKGTTFRLFFKL
ncbi:chemotaxis protein CheR [Rhodocytophaga rosea]|uniref:protein-glutamate O-methyltransferase n=1 Tax=Rhodocytophaga rosea TaxID=2704465 RepID=A0A6C0GBF2_9BACT|nr:chemotaxis protein CheB [Rhodocytophaga rosea]QHT65309.1 chemotaxis protein CheR [Rhodocytophaga rosea]